MSFLCFLVSKYIFSTFGVGILRLLKEFCQAECIPGFEAHGDLPGFAWDFHQDLSTVFLVYSPRNVNRYSSEHPHYLEAYETMQGQNMIHQFCTKCDDVTCLVNSTMLRIVYICMFYLDKVRTFTLLLSELKILSALLV